MVAFFYCSPVAWGPASDGGRHLRDRARCRACGAALIGAVVMAVALSVGRPATCRADAQLPFPRPAAIQPNVDFWVNVFTRYSVRDFAIVDRDNISRVYQVFHLPGDGAPNREEIDWVNAYLKSKYGDILEKLAEGRAPISYDERRVAEMFKGEPLSAYATAAQNLRVQEGLKERFREGLVRSRYYRPTMERIFRQAGLAEDSLHRGPVVAAADQSFAETFLEPFLHAQILRGGCICAQRLALEHLGHAPFVIADRRAALGELFKDVAVLGLEVGVDPIDLFAVRGAVAGQMKNLVNARDIVAIDDREVADRVARENVDPEIDVGLNRGGAWERQLRVGATGCGASDAERHRHYYRTDKSRPASAATRAIAQMPSSVGRWSPGNRGTIKKRDHYRLHSEALIVNDDTLKRARCRFGEKSIVSSSDLRKCGVPAGDTPSYLRVQSRQRIARHERIFIQGGPAHTRPGERCGMERGRVRRSAANQKRPGCGDGAGSDAVAGGLRGFDARFRGARIQYRVRARLRIHRCGAAGRQAVSRLLVHRDFGQRFVRECRVAHVQDRRSSLCRGRGGRRDDEVGGGRRNRRHRAAIGPYHVRRISPRLSYDAAERARAGQLYRKL